MLDLENIRQQGELGINPPSPWSNPNAFDAWHSGRKAAEERKGISYSASGGGAGSFVAFIVSGIMAVYAHQNGAEPIVACGVFLGALFVSSVIFNLLSRLLGGNLPWLLGAAGGAVLLIMWIRDFVLNYTSHAFPYNWVAGWYFYFFSGLKYLGILLVTLVAWPWSLETGPFSDKDWNILFCLAYNLTAVIALFFAGRSAWRYAVRRNWNAKLPLVLFIIVFGPGVVGLLWKIVSVLIHWLRS